MTNATRTEVGTSKMGNVFIFTRDDGTYMVRAGNHTLGTYGTEAEAEAVARVLVGDANLNVAFEADEPVDVAATTPSDDSPVPVLSGSTEAYVEEKRASIAKVKGKK